MFNPFNFMSRILHMMLGIGMPNAFPPPLSPERESECFALARRGDEKAREELIVHNLRLVSHIVRKYYSSSPGKEDLVSVGTIGLVKAVDSFDPAHGARFATYAAKCIQNEILMSFRRERKLASEIPMGESIDYDRDGNALTYEDILATEENPAEEVDLRIMSERAIRFVRTLLDERERRVIALRYGIGRERAHTQAETARLLGISRSYVSRIEKCALEKLAAGFGVQRGRGGNECKKTTRCGDAGK